MEYLQWSVAARVGTITLDRPEVLNALNRGVLEELLETVDEATRDDSVGAVVVTGEGRSFCVGSDIKEMVDSDEEAFAHLARLYQTLAGALREIPKPVIASINGYCLGGGLELALMCDVRIAAESATFGLPDLPLGFSPTGGLTFLLPRVVGLGRALHLALSAEPIPAEEAKAIGLVGAVVPDGQLAAEAQRFAEAIAGSPATGVANTKRSFHASATGSFQDALALEEAFDVECFATPETRRALSDFLARKRS